MGSVINLKEFLDKVTISYCEDQMCPIQKDQDQINDLSDEIKKLGGIPNIGSTDKKIIIKELNKQLEVLNIKNVLSDKNKNIIKDENINNIKVRFQKINDLSPKDLRKLVDEGKNYLKEGIVVVCANKDDKVGLAIGVTDSLTKNYDAVELVKAGSEIIGGKGGGGRKDFAQAGGNKKDQIDEAFNKIKTLIK